MKILVNNNELPLSNSVSVNELIESLDLNFEKIAVEINRVIVPRSEYDMYFIKENDEVEIIRAVGGG